MPTLSNPLVGGARHAAILMLTTSLTLMASACGDDSTEPEDRTILGVWNATSFDVLGDFIDEGLSVTVTITGTETSGTMQIQYENDVDGAFCPNDELECSQTGTYTATATQITLDLNDDDGPVTFNYVMTSDDAMTWSGTIEAIPATIMFERA